MLLSGELVILLRYFSLNVIRILASESGPPFPVSSCAVSEQSDSVSGPPPVSASPLLIAF